MGLLKYEDFPAGEIIEYGAYKITAGEIISFALEYDPQAFHTDPEAAKTLMLGGHAASGWHTACVWMKLMIAERDRRDAGLLERGLRLPAPGPSPGFRQMRWNAPVFSGDTVTYDSIIAEKRVSASRPGWGLVFFHNSGVNQHGVKVFEFRGSAFWERRGV